MKKAVMHIGMAIPGIAVVLYFLPIWYFPESNFKGLIPNGTLGILVLISFSLSVLLNVISGIKSLSVKHSKYYNTISRISIILFVLLIVPFLQMTYSFIFSITGWPMFPPQD